MRNVTCVLGLAPLLLVAACTDTLVCPAGLIDRDGFCEEPIQCQPKACGVGFHYDAVLCQCHADPVDAGPGMDGAASCSESIDCPTETHNTHVTVCGNIYDLETSVPIADPASVEVRFYDPLVLLQTPTTPPIAITTADSCGRYRFTHAPRPSLGYIAIGVEDMTASGEDRYVLTGAAYESAAAETIKDFNVFLLRKDTDAAWSAAAGLSPTIGERGAYVAIFLDGATPLAPLPGSPIPGKTITAGMLVSASNDYYFADTDPLTRSVIDQGRSSTGVNGTAIYVDAQGAPTFGAPACEQPIGATLPGIVLVKENLCQ